MGTALSLSTVWEYVSVEVTKLRDMLVGLYTAHMYIHICIYIIYTCILWLCKGNEKMTMLAFHYKSI